MNREIKFRAWDQEAELWRYFTLESAIRGMLLRADGLQKFRLDKKCEFTGLKDEKGVEIYEGDIVKITHEDNRHDCDDECDKPCTFDTESKNVQVVWDKDFGGFVWSEVELFDGEYTMGFNAEPYLYEVIGNIYENPELLKVETKPTN